MRTLLYNSFERYKTSMKMLRVDNPNNCLYCGKKLSLIHSFRDLLYCNNSHRSAHSRALDNLGLLRLMAEPKSPSEIRWEHCEQRMKAEDLRQCASLVGCDADSKPEVFRERSQ